MSDLVQQGIAAIKAGDKAEARQLLAQALRADPWNEQAWLWLSGAVESDDERLMCLNKVLEVNPGNGAAQRGVAMLQQKLGTQPSSSSSSSPSPPSPSSSFLHHYRFKYFPMLSSSIIALSNRFKYFAHSFLLYYCSLKSSHSHMNDCIHSMWTKCT